MKFKLPWLYPQLHPNSRFGDPRSTSRCTVAAVAPAPFRAAAFAWHPAHSPPARWGCLDIYSPCVAYSVASATKWKQTANHFWGEKSLVSSHGVNKPVCMFVGNHRLLAHYTKLYPLLLGEILLTLTNRKVSLSQFRAGWIQARNHEIWLYKGT
jgi:hypothetical protein